MKIYQLTITINDLFAQVRMNPNQSIQQGQAIAALWDDWDVRGNKISDFVFSVGYNICKKTVFKELSERFSSIKSFDLQWTKNPKEITAKNISRLKWLPQETVDLKIIYTDKEMSLLPESSVKYTIEDDEIYIDSETLDGIAEMRGDLIIPRKKNKGFYFDKNEVQGFDFFKPKHTGGYLFCSENVKRFCEEREYTNVVFLEIGETI
jgi:hypothetical protein